MADWRTRFLELGDEGDRFARGILGPAYPAARSLVTLGGMLSPASSAEDALAASRQTAAGVQALDPAQAMIGTAGMGAGILGMVPIAGTAIRGARAAGQAAGDAFSAARAPITPEGFAIKGKDYSRASQQVLAEIAEGPKGAGPLDLSASALIPETPQASMLRYVPPRGVSPRLQRALENPDVMSGVRESIQQGINMGADKWYHTEPIRQAFLKEYGEDLGPERFARFMDYVAATSPRSDVSTNIRNASDYYSREGMPTSKEDLVYPYGHLAQNLHLQNAQTVQGPGWDIYRNPKPSSFSENLQGNLAPVTVDTHAFRNIAMRTRDPEFLETSISVPNKTGKSAENATDEEKELLTLAAKYGEISPDKKNIIFRPQKLMQEGRLAMEDALKIPSFWASKPRENEYAAAEGLYRQLADDFGIAPADAQAAAWAGAGKLTGLASPPTKTFPELFNERVSYTARMRGEDPAETLRMMIRGERPLLGIGAAAGGTGILGAGTTAED
jgi:hypothetical protein